MSIETLDPQRFNAVKAERNGVNTLIMRKLDKSIKRADKKMANWELEYRWHKSPESDVSSVQGNEYIYLQSKEWDINKPLFDQFRLFP